MNARVSNRDEAVYGPEDVDDFVPERWMKNDRRDGGRMEHEGRADEVLAADVRIRESDLHGEEHRTARACEAGGDVCCEI
jgi:hypothetical protein